MLNVVCVQLRVDCLLIS